MATQALVTGTLLLGAGGEGRCEYLNSLKKINREVGLGEGFSESLNMRKSASITQIPEKGI